MRRTLTLLAVATLFVSVLSTTAGAVEEDDPATPTMKTHAADALFAPSTPNPYVSFLPAGAKPDYATWNEFLRAAGVQRAAAAPPARGQAIRFGESEPPNLSGVNDTIATADYIGRLGTGTDDIARAIVAGNAPTPAAGATLDISPAEEDGSFGTATEAEILAGDVAEASAIIGDGVWGSAGAGTGDFDFYAVRGVSAGDAIVVDVDTPDPFGDLDPFIVVWDASGDQVGLNDDDGVSYDSFLVAVAPADGDYFVSVGGFGAFFPVDPTVPGSPSISGDVGSEGSYDMSIEVQPLDADVFTFDADAGDIVGATVAGGAQRLSLQRIDATELVGSSQDASFIYPQASRLPGGGLATVAYVIDTPGTYALANTATGPYHIDLRLFRPAKERKPGASQTLFLDFDGASIDPGIFLGGAFGFEVPLSPLASFLPGWGLNAGDEDAVIDAVVAAVEESLSADMRALGNNGDFDVSGVYGDFDIEILNSRDDPDPWGERYVSRVIVGGTIPELGIGTIGIAQSIDVGDFESEESAVVLLDLLSDPNVANPNSLNSFPRDPSSSIIDLIGVGVGNIVAHEAGHFFANWHTDQFNPSANLMDQGGNLPNTVGLGADGVFGTADDVDVDFGTDVFVPNEGFTGLEDTLQAIAFGLSTSAPRR